METYRKLKWFSLFALITLVISACEKKVEPTPTISKTSLEGHWRYDNISAVGYSFIFASTNLEPGQFKDALGGERAELARRRIQYFDDGTYQLQWADRGDYSLGTEGDPNWQPSYGYYQINEAGDSLFHNKGLPYETLYIISFEGNQMIRTSQRYMSVNSKEYSSVYLWQRGDVVMFKEHFERL